MVFSAERALAVLPDVPWPYTIDPADKVLLRLVLKFAEPMRPGQLDRVCRAQTVSESAKE